MLFFYFFLSLLGTLATHIYLLVVVGVVASLALAVFRQS